MDIEKIRSSKDLLVTALELIDRTYDGASDEVMEYINTAELNLLDAAYLLLQEEVCDDEEDIEIV